MGHVSVCWNGEEKLAARLAQRTELKMQQPRHSSVSEDRATDRKKLCLPEQEGTVVAMSGWTVELSCPWSGLVTAVCLAQVPLWDQRQGND